MTIIKHVRSMDVAFQVYRILDIGHKLVVKGLWINQGFVESYPIQSRPQTIKILKGDISDWLKCDNPRAKCCRYENWSPFQK